MLNVFSRRDVLASGTALAWSLAAPLRAASNRRTNFLVVGDWGRDGGDYQEHVARHMALEAARTDARFVVSTGDNFYKVGISSVSDPQWESSFYKIYSDPWLQRRWYPVLGNHDYGGKVFEQVKKSDPQQCWQMRDRWYKVNLKEHDGPDADIFFTDSVAFTGGEKFPFSIFGTSVNAIDAEAHYVWLEKHLRESEAPMKIVVGHYPIYSIGPHGGKMKMERLDRLLRRYGVTAYVNGHDHCLYHIQSREMDYICSGGGSQELKAYTGDPKRYGCVIPGSCDSSNDRSQPLPVWLSFVDRAGFASFDVGEDVLRFSLIDRSGIVFHTHTIVARPPDPSVAID